MQPQFRNELALGALLHDIGKFKQRSGLPEDRGKPHTEIGYQWLMDQYGQGPIAIAARNHHASEKETWESNFSLVICEADNCSASERRSCFDFRSDIESKWQRTIRLATVFSRVKDPSGDELKSGAEAQAAFQPMVTTDRWTTPDLKRDQEDAASYIRLWQAFCEDFHHLREVGNHFNIDAVLHLLEKYTGTVASITLKVTGADDGETYRKHPDISLFDHMKITAACALCLADYYAHQYGCRWEGPQAVVLKDEIAGAATWHADAEQPFILVGGDLSGVQRFIYTISSKGALRSLKGRSFFLELLTEHVVDRLLEETGLTCCNVIFTGGGHFYIVAANVPATREALKKVRREINDWLLHEYSGLLYQCIEAEPFRKSDLKAISPVWHRLSTKLEEAKARKWDRRLDEILCEPAMPHVDCETTRCKVCGREDRPLSSLVDGDEPDTCTACMDQWRLGRLLQEAVRKGGNPVIYRWNHPPDMDRTRYVEICGRFYQPAAEASTGEARAITVGATAAFHLNQWDFAGFDHPRSRPMLAGLYMPRNPEIHDLEDMANRGTGMGKLAVLRMDVDNLGRIFSQGIPQGERTLSRMASLSRQISLFFKYHINGLLLQDTGKGYPSAGGFLEANRRILRQNEQRPVRERLLSVVYSGGDDLFVIGHWRDVTEAAVDIQAAFAACTANRFITISGGITQDHVHQPVYRLAEAAGRAEERSKEAGKDRVTFMDRHTFTWRQVEELGVWFDHVSAFAREPDGQMTLAPGAPSTAFFYRLLEIARRMKDRDTWNIIKLAWLLGRARVSVNYSNEFKVLKNSLFTNTIDWHQVEVALLWLFMLMRKGKETS